MPTFEVLATLQLEGFHRWESAPDAVSFLRERHRHLFHMELLAPVMHADRDVEIIDLRRRAIDLLTGRFGEPCEFGTLSCEHIAEFLLVRLHLSRCTVLEDGENGGVAYA